MQCYTSTLGTQGMQSSLFVLASTDLRSATPILVPDDNDDDVGRVTALPVVELLEMPHKNSATTGTTTPRTSKNTAQGTVDPAMELFQSLWEGARVQIDELQEEIETLRYWVECRACYDKFSDRVLDCGHTFCTSCLLRWKNSCRGHLDGKVICLLCKQPSTEMRRLFIG